MNRKSRRASNKKLYGSIATRHRSKGEGLVRSGQFQEASSAFQRAIALDPLDGISHSNLAFTLAQMDDLDGAVDSYERALELQPDNPAIQTNLGLLLVNRGMLDDAMECFRKAVAAKPDHIEALYQLGQTSKVLNQQDQAAEYFNRSFQAAWRAAQADSAGNGGVMLKLGRSLMELDRTKDALMCFLRAAEITPDEIMTHYLAGVAHSKLDDLTKAVPCFRRAIELDSDNIRLHKRLGFALMELGEIDDAAVSLQKVLDQHPDDHTVRHFLSAATPAVAVDESRNKYVESLFDDYAEEFDDHLVNVLHYQAPELLRLAIGREMEADDAAWDVIDLGCGTGLCGHLFRDLAAHLIGVDLSDGMLEQARKRNIYDDLRQGDMKQALADKDNAYDLIIAADVFIYIDDLSDIFGACARALRPGGWFAFTTETTDKEPFYLDITGRYRHNTEYVRNLASTHRFQINQCHEISTRQQDGNAVAAQLFVLTRRE